MNLKVLPAGAALAVSAFAHHNFAAEFDESKPISLHSIVAKVDWINPHIYLYLDVKLEDGTTVRWTLESGGPHALERTGWRRDSVKPGDEVIVGGFVAKKGANCGSALQVRHPKGAGALAFAPPVYSK